MSRGIRAAGRGLVLVVACGAAWVGPAAAASSSALNDAALASQLHELKQLQLDILMGGAEAREEGSRLERWRRAFESWREPERRRRLAALGSRVPSDPIGPRGPGGLGLRTLHSAVVPAHPLVLPVNRRMNDFTTDVFPAGTTQSEMTLAGRGDVLVSAWNDGLIATDGKGGIGFAVSTNGGATWADGGTPPFAGDVLVWSSDPVLTVNEKTGEFYLCALTINEGPKDALAVVKGSMTGNGFVWDAPYVVRAIRDTFPDKPWIAADSLTGNLYVTYTTFFRVGDTRQDQIEFQSSSDGGVTWTAPRKISDEREDGLVQGSRIVAGPDGEIHTAWLSVDTTRAAGGADYLRVRMSRDGGTSFETPEIAATVFSNFASGAPGFDRGSGLGFPALAVDRSTGPYRGRVYVIWSEPLDYYDDRLGLAGDAPEIEPNDQYSNASPITIGATVHGEISGSADVDLLRFAGSRGQTVAIFADSLGDDLDLSFRLTCSDLSTQLAFSGPSSSKRRFMIFTLPEDGSYFLVIRPGGAPGGYRIRTGWVLHGAERGRDHRDVFASSSDDGHHWREPTRVNDEPPWFDDWLPEIAIAGNGRVFAAWYDWRDAPVGTCGGVSSLYLSRSDDGGASWTSQGPVTTVQTAWSAVASNLSPNQGDYLALFANERAVYPCWADGRHGSPDAFMAVWNPGPTTAQVAVVAAHATPDRVTITWHVTGDRNFVASVQRRVGEGPWVTRTTRAPDEHGDLAYVDLEVTPGQRYGYRLGIPSDQGEIHGGEVSIEVPAAALAIQRIQPNPGAGPLRVSYVLARAVPARLELLDVRGRRIRAATLAAQAGPGLVELAAAPALAPGLYVVRLTQGAESVSAKAVVLR